MWTKGSLAVLSLALVAGCATDGSLMPARSRYNVDQLDVRLKPERKYVFVVAPGHYESRETTDGVSSRDPRTQSSVRMSEDVEAYLSEVPGMKAVARSVREEIAKERDINWGPGVQVENEETFKKLRQKGADLLVVPFETVTRAYSTGNRSPQNQYEFLLKAYDVGTNELVLTIRTSYERGILQIGSKDETKLRKEALKTAVERLKESLRPGPGE